MIVTNKKDYFKAGQTKRDTILAVYIPAAFILMWEIPIIIIFSGVSCLVFSILWLLLFLVGVRDSKEYLHRKKIIVSKRGILILEKEGRCIKKLQYNWESINEIRYQNWRYTRDSSTNLYITGISYKKNWKGVDKELVTNSIALREFLPYAPFNRDYNKEIDNVLSNLCKAHRIKYVLDLNYKAS